MPKQLDENTSIQLRQLLTINGTVWNISISLMDLLNHYADIILMCICTFSGTKIIDISNCMCTVEL